MKLENRYKQIKTGELFKITNFTTTLDSVLDFVTLKSLSSDKELEMDESKFVKYFVKVKDDLNR